YSQMFRLSPQERRLLACAVRGVPDKCAADELGCTRNTVGTYWKRIYAKTGKRCQKDVLAHLLRVLACGSHAKSPGSHGARPPCHQHRDKTNPAIFGPLAQVRPLARGCATHAGEK